jgi:hypothetical protein
MNQGSAFQPIYVLYSSALSRGIFLKPAFGTEDASKATPGKFNWRVAAAFKMPDFECLTRRK